jgi:hypothetical protein
MPISRGQMNRQLYGVGSLVGREKFGIGSKLKRFVRKIIPNEVADVAVKAAPFVAPFNPALGGAMAGLGSFDQSGSISKGVKSGLLNYGLGQGARYLGGAELQGNPFEGKLFSTPIGTKRTGLGTFLDKGKDIGATVSDIPSNEIVKPTVRGEVSVGDMGGYLDPIAKTSAEATTSSAFKKSLGKITSGDFTEMGQGLKELGGQGLKAIYTTKAKDGSTQIDKLAIGATIAGGVSYLDAKRLAEEAELVGDADEYTEEMYEADKARYSDYYADIITPAAFGLKEGGRVKYQSGSTPFGVPSITLDEKDEDGIDLEALKKEVEENPTMVNEITDIEFGVGKPGPYTDQGPYIKVDEEKEIEDMLNELDRELNKKADGGRIGFFEGSDDPKGVISINPLQDDLEELKGGFAGAAPGLLKLMSRGAPTFTSAEKTLVIRNLAGRSKGTADYKKLGINIPQAKAIMDNPAKNLKDATILKEFVKAVMGKKEGGRIGYMMGSEVPVRKNQGGITELDYRNTGGFVPVGIKEKADDVPAMLSKNEFVMTADAVRGIGNGDVETGAQKLYNIMKQAEKQGIA